MGLKREPRAYEVRHALSRQVFVTSVNTVTVTPFWLGIITLRLTISISLTQQYSFSSTLPVEISGRQINTVYQTQTTQSSGIEVRDRTTVVGALRK